MSVCDISGPAGLSQNGGWRHIAAISKSCSVLDFMHKLVEIPLVEADSSFGPIWPWSFGAQWNGLDVVRVVKRFPFWVHERTISTNRLGLQLHVVHVSSQAFDPCFSLVIFNGIGHQQGCRSVQNEHELDLSCCHLNVSVIKKEQIAKDLISHTTDFASRWHRLLQLTCVAAFDYLVKFFVDLLRKPKMSRPLLELFSAHVIVLQMQLKQLNRIPQLVMDPF